MFVDVGGGELRCDMLGTGVSLLCMHGGLGLDHSYFRPWLEPLASCARLVLYDHRGNGVSTRPSSYEEMSIATLADDAELLRRGLDLDRIVLLGHSYGGVVALQYALSHPDSLRGLVLCATAACFDHLAGAVERALPGMTSEQRRAFSELARPRVLDDETFGRHARTILPLYFHEPNENVMRDMHRSTHYSGAAYDVSMRAWLPGFDVRSRLKDIGVPVLVIAGADDWITPVPVVEQLAEGLPAAEFHVLQGCGHYPFVEQQDEFLAVVRRWFERLDSAV